MKRFIPKMILNKLQHPKKQLNKGFTLIELLVVVVIIGILSGVALPNFLKQREKAKVGAANAQAAALINACEVAIVNDIDDLATDDDLSRLVTSAETSYPSDATDVAMTITVTNSPISDDTATTDVDESADRGCIVAITGSALDPNVTASFTSFGSKTPAKGV